MNNLKPIRTFGYKCPRCHASLIGDYSSAQSHVNIKEDSPLPNGFAYLSSNKGCINIIYGAGHLSSDTHEKTAHGREQPILKYSLNLNMMLAAPLSYVNSREVRDGLEKGILKILPEPLFLEVKSKSRMLETEKGIRLILLRELEETL